MNLLNIVIELVKDVCHNLESALVTGSDEDGLIIQPTIVEQYEL